jgi:hypothetical protein
MVVAYGRREFIISVCMKEGVQLGWNGALRKGGREGGSLRLSIYEI